MSSKSSHHDLLSLYRASTSLERSIEDISASEHTPLLTRSKTERRYGVSRTPLLRRQNSAVSTINNPPGGQTPTGQKLASLRWALSQALEVRPQHTARRLSMVNPNLSEKSSFNEVPAYDQFTSIDWIRDTVKNANDSKRLKKRRCAQAQSCFLWLDDVQGWVLAALVGLCTAVLAWLIDVTEPTLFKTKLGFCKSKWFAGPQECCQGSGKCENWIEWSSVKPIPGIRFNLGFTVYLVTMLAMSLVACLLVLSHRRAILRKGQTSYVGRARHAEYLGSPRSQHPPAAIYPATGSGVAEVKVIASGFIIHGFLGVRTLIIKALGCTLSNASGLSVGLEGPYVHLAACIGNILSKLFPKYRNNDGNTREIISAASAAGVAVAFGAPISGVLFSLEEVSYYFPSQTLLRTFFCSACAALFLKLLNPYGNNKIVLFSVEYHGRWRPEEMVVFVLLGLLGGAVGALFVKATRVWAKKVRSQRIFKNHPIFEVAFVALVSAAMSYWNRYSKLPVAELMYELSSDCRDLSRNRSGLCPTPEEIPSLLKSLSIAFIIKFILTTIAYGLKIPAGIYLPTMAIGGLLGRFIGHALQLLFMAHSPNQRIGACVSDGNPETCLAPGVYALLTAGAVMVGTTRLTITIVLMLFELSGSLDYVLPFAMAVITAKWTADFVERMSIYDLLLETNDYPFLEKSRPKASGTLADLMPFSPHNMFIDISDRVIVSSSELGEKLDHMIATGQTDGGLALISNGNLVGIISCPELASRLDTIDPIIDTHCLVAPAGRVADTVIEEDWEDQATDLTAIIDSAPLCLEIHSPLVLVHECFVRLGVRYIPVLHNGSYVGLVHKKAFLRHIRNLKESE